MQVKALDHVEDTNQIQLPDGNGGFLPAQSVLTVLEAGSIYDLPDDQAGRLIARGLVSEDLEAPLLPHLVRD